jgi:hypothetical protein|tara:strand:+ start:1062 stop:1427 length:366 start_codon:yes stop_codon:yes gene_type:complete
MKMQPQAAQPAQQVIVGQPAQYTVGAGSPIVGAMAYPATSATTALVMSILGFMCCGLFAIPGMIMANGALAITDKVPGHPDASMAKIAQVLSIVVLVLWALGIAFYVLLFGLALGAESSGY